jgi:hypothetical protein
MIAGTKKINISTTKKLLLFSFKYFNRSNFQILVTNLTNRETERFLFPLKNPSLRLITFPRKSIQEKTQPWPG